MERNTFLACKVVADLMLQFKAAAEATIPGHYFSKDGLPS
jgi:hypothetical protein